MSIKENKNKQIRLHDMSKHCVLILKNSFDYKSYFPFLI